MENSRRVLGIIVAGSLLALAISAAPATASTVVDYQTDPTSTTLFITDASGDADAITVSASGNTLTIRDTGVGGIVTGDPHCAKRNATTVTCPLNPRDPAPPAPPTAPVRKIDLHLDDGRDRFTNQNFNVFVDDLDVHSAGVKTISSGPGPDQLRLGAANDVVNAGPGADFVFTGPGNDRVSTGPDDDDYASDPGTDRVDLGGGDDVVRGNGFRDGPDSLTGGSGPGDAVIFTGSAPVTMALDGRADDGHAGEGDNLSDFEQFTGTAGADTIGTDGSANYILGQGGPDRISAGGGGDHIEPGPGDDLVDAGVGNDFVKQGATDDGADRINGGAGGDFVDYCCGTAPVRIAEDGAANDGHPGEGDSLMGLEGLEGGDGADTLSGTDAADALYGFGGDDRLDGLGGSDQLFGGGGDDTLVGGGGSDTVQCDDGFDSILAGATDDIAAGCERRGATLSGRSARVNRRGRALVKVACPDSERTRCRGKVQLKRKGKSVGRGRFHIRPGKKERVNVRLKKPLRKKVLSHRHGVHVKALAKTRLPEGISVDRRRIRLRRS